MFKSTGTHEFVVGSFVQLFVGPQVWSQCLRDKLFTASTTLHFSPFTSFQGVLQVWFCIRVIKTAPGLGLNACWIGVVPGFGLRIRSEQRRCWALTQSLFFSAARVA